jgi:hypothetical protein
LCRALHPHPEGEPPLSTALRHHRRAAPRRPRLQGHLQPDLDRRAPWLPDTRGLQSGAACAPPGRSMSPQRGVSQLWTATPYRRSRGDHPLWIAGLPTQDSWRSLRQAT